MIYYKHKQNEFVKRGAEELKREWLILYRGERSQMEMAEKYQVTQQTWSNWELGKSSPDISIMKQMEMDSGIPIGELFF